MLFPGAAMIIVLGQGGKPDPLLLCTLHNRVIGSRGVHLHQEVQAGVLLHNHRPGRQGAVL